MKKIYLLISSAMCLGLLASCFDMNQEPQGELATSEAFSTTNEITTYLNMFYQGAVSKSGGGTVPNTAIKSHPSNANSGLAFGDVGSDNLLYYEFDSRLSGELSISSAANLDDYSAIRNVNFLLQNIGRCEDQTSSAFQQCLGEAYYFRAAYYYHLLVNYGGVTWVDTPLDPDAGLMQQPRNTRTDLTEKILYDLDLAIQMGDCLWLQGKELPMAVGSPEDLILQHRFGVFFNKDDISFDESTGKISMTTPTVPIGIEGDFKVSYWVGNALIRNGFLPSPKSDNYLSVVCENAENLKIYRQGNLWKVSHTVAELIQNLF